MAYPVKLSALCTRTLQAANLEGAGDFVTPTELTDYVNGSIAEWVDEVRGTTWNGTYSRSSYTRETVGGQRTYPLPADFLTLLSVDVYVTQNSPVISAIAYQEEQRNAFNNYPVMFGWGASHPIYYQLQDGNISFIPVPQGEFTFRLNYTPTAPTLSDPDDYIDSINGWEEFIILDAAIKCLTKAGELEMIQELKERRERQRQRIRTLAPRRDQHTAERVHVIANQDFGEWDW